MMTRRKLWPSTLIAGLALLSACTSRRPAAKREEVGPAPATFRALFNTTKGDFVILVHRDWAPNGADRFYELLKLKFFDDNYFFRIVPHFIVQWGINGDPKVAKNWENLTIQDDSVKESNKRGTVTFATAGPGTRTTQLFINLNNNAMLDGQGFSPFGEVSEGMSVVENLYAGYGDGPPRGRGPDQTTITGAGNGYLEEHFPLLDHIKRAQIIP